MNKTAYTITAAAALLGAAVFAFAIQSQGGRTVTGAIVDAKCVPTFMRGDDPEAAAVEFHDVGCAASDAGVKSGLVIIAGNRQIKIDPSTNQVVVDYLKSKDATTQARVSGSDGPNGFAVRSVARMKPKNPN